MPPFIGSMIFRSVQFTAYEIAFSEVSKHKSLDITIPFTPEVKLRVILGGLFAGLCRSVLECPFEYAKVKRQTHQQWHWNEIYKGYQPMYIRATAVLTWYFFWVDVIRRKTKMWDYKAGQFLVSGFCAMTGFWVCWPFEVMKNLAQAGNI